MIFKKDNPIWNSPRSLEGKISFSMTLKSDFLNKNESDTNSWFQDYDKICWGNRKTKNLNFENQSESSRDEEKQSDGEAIKQAETIKE